jgi:pimeloyl-ACP methyl ester carboxylesterase
METVTSHDGTTIAFDRTGQGPAVILVGGALTHRAIDPLNGPLAELLAADFTVYRYDRRGRGDSGDTQPYAVEREVEDLEALLAHAGGTAYAYGVSSGAVLVLHAARRLPGLTKLALYEPPFVVDGSHLPRGDDYIARTEQAVATGRPGAAIEEFMTWVGIPPEELPSMRELPFWPAMEAVAHTLAYDYRVMGDTQLGRPLDAGRWAAVTAPTLVADGEKTEPFLHAGANAIARILPSSTRRTLPGQDHGVAADAIAPVLREFFKGGDDA